MKFEVSEELQKWIKQHLVVCQSKTFDGAQFRYQFIPTALVEVQTVKCLCCGEKKTAYVDCRLIIQKEGTTDEHNQT